MSDHKALREAFVAGATWSGFSAVTMWGRNLPLKEAEVRYPAPKVERPRVVTLNPPGWGREVQFRMNDENLQYLGGGKWWDYCAIDRAFYTAIFDLFDHPTELVEAED